MALKVNQGSKSKQRKEGVGREKGVQRREVGGRGKGRRGRGGEAVSIEWTNSNKNRVSDVTLCAE